MSEVLQDLSGPSIVNAIERNTYEYHEAFRFCPRIEVHHELDMLWTISDYPSPLFNTIHNAQIDLNDIDNNINEVIQPFKQRRVMVGWHIGPNTRPYDLASHLDISGFTTGRPGVAMAIDLRLLDEEQHKPDNFMIKQVKDTSTMAHWVETFCKGFGMPTWITEPLKDLSVNTGLGKDAPMTNFIGYSNEKPVATSQLFLGAGVAGIWYVATLPEERNQGYGSATTTAALLWARNLGYRIGILIASELGERIYSKMGFGEYYRVAVYRKSFVE